MLYSFFGNDIQKIRARANALVDALKVKRPDASFFRLHTEDFSLDQCLNLLSAQGLFSQKYVVTLDNILTGSDKSDISSHLTELLPKIAKSEHVWIIIEDQLFGLSSGKELSDSQSKKLDGHQKNLEKHSEKVELYNFNQKTKVNQKSNVTSFTFIDAVFNRNLLQATTALDTLIKEGIAPEEVHGAFWWQIKSIHLVASGDTKGISPFVVKKATGFLKKWDARDIDNLTKLAVSAYHNAHAGRANLYDELLKVVVLYCGHE